MSGLGRNAIMDTISFQGEGSPQTTNVFPSKAKEHFSNIPPLEETAMTLWQYLNYHEE